MEFWSTIAGLLHRKWVIIPVVLVALSLGAVAYFSTAVRYVSSTTMVLATTEYGGSESQNPTQPTPLSNPMLNFNDSLKTTSAILIQAMNTKDIDTQLGADGATELIVNDGRTNPDLLGTNGPFIYVAARSTSSTEAARVVGEAQQVMREKLRAWQGTLNAPQKTYVSIVDVVPPSAPVPDRARKTKLGLIGLGLGFVVSMGVAYFGNRLRGRRADPDATAWAGRETTLAIGRGTARAPRPARPGVAAAEDDVADPGSVVEEDREPVFVPSSSQESEAHGAAALPPRLRKEGATASAPTRITWKPEPVTVPPSESNGERERGVPPVPLKMNARARKR